MPLISEAGLLPFFAALRRDLDALGQRPKKGSVATLAGRTAGVAMELGHAEDAKNIWSLINPPTGFPGIEEFHQAFIARKAQFGAFADEKNFSAAGTPFSNAAGSYAYALDYLNRGAAALADGDAQSCCTWGAEALRAAGFEEKAQLLEKAWLAPNPNAVMGVQVAPSASITNGGPTR